MAAVILLIAVFVQREYEQRQAKTDAKEIFYQIEQILKENQTELAEIEEAYRQTCLHNAEAIAYMIQDNPEILGDVEEFRYIAELMEVDEIHIFDKTGRIFTGTHPEYYDYTFDSGEQIGFFKPMLKDKSLKLFQDIMPNTAESKLVQYSALWSSDGEFIVQVGMDPANVLKATEKNEMSYIFSLLKANAGVDLYAVDPQSGQIMGSTTAENTGKNLTEIGFDLDDIEKYEKGAQATVDGVDSYCVFMMMGDNLMGYIVSNDMLYEDIPIQTVGLAVCLIVIALILAFTVAWCTNRFVIEGIHDINKKLNSIAEGYLDERVDVRSSREFSELSSYINDMIRNLLSSTEKISYVLNQTNILIGVYEYSEKMKRVRFTEHIPTILALDADTTKKLSSDWKLFRAHMDKLRKNLVPGEESVLYVSEDMEDCFRLEEIINGSDTIGIIVDVTDEIITRRQIEAERDMDLLTGLYNRRGLENQLSMLFKSSEQLGCGALIMIDADGLKEINDVYGHAAGDVYLKKIAEVISSFGFHSSVSSRQGGDEFVLFLYDYDSEAELLDSIDKLKYIQNNSKVQLDENLTVPLKFSIGYTLIKGRSDYQNMLNEADERMYAVKRERKKTKAVSQGGDDSLG